MGGNLLKNVGMKKKTMCLDSASMNWTLTGEDPPLHLCLLFTNTKTTINKNKMKGTMLKKEYQIYKKGMLLQLVQRLKCIFKQIYFTGFSFAHTLYYIMSFNFFYFIIFLLLHFFNFIYKKLDFTTKHISNCINYWINN